MNKNSKSDTNLEGFSFNKALKELQAIVAQMEDPELDLKDAIANFEKATKIAKTCKEQLKVAEVTIKELMITINDTDDIKE